MNNRNTISFIRKTIINEKLLVGDIIFSELIELHKSLILEKKRFIDSNILDKEIGKRLLFLFQCDLLPGKS